MALFPPNYSNYPAGSPFDPRGIGIGAVDPNHWNHNHIIKNPFTLSTDNMSKFSESNMGQMLTVRMGWNVGAPNCTFKKWSAHKLSDTEAVVFVIVGEMALTIIDDLNLFPSDALVTQLRLLAETGK